MGRHPKNKSNIHHKVTKTKWGLTDNCQIQHLADIIEKKKTIMKMCGSVNLSKHVTEDITVAAEGRFLSTEKVRLKLHTALKETEVLQLHQASVVWDQRWS